MEITIPVTETTHKKYMALRQAVGNGTYGDKKLVIDAAIPTFSPIITYDGRVFNINIHDIAKAVAQMVESGG